MDDKWFKRQQKIAGVTAEDIAREMGRDRSVVSNIYTGKRGMSLEYAKAFSKVLNQPLATVLEKAGAADPETTQELSSGLTDSDLAEWKSQQGLSGATMQVIDAFGGTSSGMKVWKLQNSAMALAGYLEGDFVLADMDASERVRAGDTVVARVFDNINKKQRVVLRRFDPPVLVSASSSREDAKVFVVDNNNVVVTGRVVASWRM